MYQKNMCQGRDIYIWGFSEMGGTSKSSILDWDFPWNKPSILVIPYSHQFGYGKMNPQGLSEKTSFSGIPFTMVGQP